MLFRSGFFSYGVWTNDQPLQPFTINTALAPIALPRTTTDATAHVVSTNLSLVSRPITDWRFSARLRVYEDTGHCPNWERPEDVAADLDAFLLPG